MRAPLSRRLIARVVWTDNNCWEFTGARSEGYGVLGVGPRGAGNIQAHRASYLHFVGPIPDGLHIDHLCRNRACVNPLHLEPVTQGVNNQRAWDARGLPTHCRRGHEMTEENTRINSHQRVCRACVRFRNQAKKESA